MVTSRPKWGELWDQDIMNYLYEQREDIAWNNIILNFKGNNYLIIGCISEDVMLKNKICDIDDKNRVGINISIEDIKISKLHGTGVHLLLADGSNNPFKDNIFDVIICKASLHHIIKYKKTLYEINKLLRSNGQAVIHEPGALNIFAYLGRKFFPTSSHSDLEKPFIPFNLKKDINQILKVENEYYFYIFCHILPILGKYISYFDNKALVNFVIKFDDILSRTFLKELCWVFIYVISKKKLT